jgi:hypothetical protein
MCAKIISRCEVANIFEEASRLFLDQDDLLAAEDFCVDALQLCESCEGNRDCIIPKLCNMATINLAMGNYEDVLRNLDRIRTMIDNPHKANRV